MKKYKIQILLILISLISSCSGATGATDAENAIERGLSYVAAAIVTHAVLNLIKFW